MPPAKANLGDNFDTFIPKDSQDNGCEPILKALLISSYNVDQNADIVTFRNNLNKIGKTPYENRDEWEIDCALVGNTVYLDVRQTDDGPTDYHRGVNIYHGYRFEALCTGTDHQPVNANSEFCSIARTRIGNHRILISSEIDCVMPIPPGEPPLKHYVELKTMKEVINERALGNMYRHRYLRYWIQSFLGGVRHIVIGHRNDQGVLESSERMRTHDLQRRAREHFQRTNARNGWDPNVCLGFLDCTLSMIREACHDYPGSTIRLRLSPRDKCIVGQVVARPGEGLHGRIVRVREEFEKTGVFKLNDGSRAG
eukprot:GFKZ01006893.1.p1 GENE.GFKZ01006893.1~~GFKZ01006893.1.p1  ORF type:complete len:338 (+),score=23.39 GFKZ01006893.1:84-1016(+)